MDDKTIVELYWQRDEQAIAETRDKYGRYCYAIAYGILHSAPDAEECENDTYLAAWRAMPPHRLARCAVISLLWNTPKRSQPLRIAQK